METEFKKYEVVWSFGSKSRLYYGGISKPYRKNNIWHWVFLPNGGANETQKIEKYKNQDNMGCSNCIKCGNMVCMYEKYCPVCVKTYNLKFKQDDNFHKNKDWSGLDYKQECERMFNEDLRPPNHLNNHDKAEMLLAFEAGNQEHDFEAWYDKTFNLELYKKTP